MSFSMKYGSNKSKYCYPDSNILINKLDIHNDELLQSIEADYSHIRLLELNAEPLAGNFDLKHLKDIHFYIFQDIYSFGGEIREEDIIKGNTRFANCKFIVSNSETLLNQLKSENFLVGTDVVTLSQRAAFYMSELNILHPFREGNGRAIREFIRCIALKANYIVNWDLLTKEELLEASIKSVLNHDDLSRCILRTISP